MRPSQVTYALPHTEYKVRLTSNSASLLAAIVQHSNIRSSIQQQSVLTYADLTMAVVYMLILLSFSSTVMVALMASDFRYQVGRR